MTKDKSVQKDALETLTDEDLEALVGGARDRARDDDDDVDVPDLLIWDIAGGS